MLERLRALWAAGRLTEAQIAAAVARGWITAADAEMIAASPVV